MSFSSQEAPAIGLREAIGAYCANPSEDLDRSARDLLARLVDNPDAAKAFERLKLKKLREELHILSACVNANKLAATFAGRIAEEVNMMVRLAKLDMSISALQKFVAQQSKRRLFVDGYRAIPEEEGFKMVQCKESELEEMKRGLILIQSLLKGRRYIAETTAPVIGATRKSHDAKASEIAATWHLAKAVRQITGMPRAREVADLAQVILGVEVSEDRVRHVLRQRQQEPHLNNRRVQPKKKVRTRR
jgi:hypothetical protein